MKNLILVIAASAFISLSVSAQSGKNVPALVKTAFSQKFVKTTDVKWGREGKTEWEAEFKLDGKSYSANFDTKGNWAETEYSITASEIPAAVKATINKEYSSYKIKGTDVSETPKGKIVEVIFVKGKKKVEVVFDENGKVTKE